jgi:hypothetical protein
MKASFWIFILFLLISSDALSQEKNWQIDLFNFFDNTEFGRSAFKIPQTMAGIVVAPEFGVVWDSIYKANIGVSLLHEYGSPNAIDKFYPTAYYELSNGPVRFIMGAFPRSTAIVKYPRLFFQDSILYYRPNINGIFWEYLQNQSYFNLWLDWTGRQSKTMNEEFFMGFSGRYQPDIFYLQHFGYMFHFAGKMDPVVDEPLHDNGLFLTSLGVDLSGRACFRKLEANAGWVIGLERSRAENTGWLTSNGLLVETRIEYKWFGLFNTFYKGGGLMHFYNKLGNNLYWGDPAYRAKTYDRSDFYISFLQSHTVNIELTYSLNFMENRMYHEQMLKVIVNMNTLKNLLSTKDRKQAK